MTPRLRHIAVIVEPDAVRPYVQLLNTSAWTLYADDLDPDHSHPELVAYLLAHGDRMTQTGEVTQAAVATAAWWLERDDDECAAFVAAAERSHRPDADAWRALAAALPWLRRLHHTTLRPPVLATPHRPIPGTGLLVPRALEPEPPRLVERWTTVARAAVDRYLAAWRGSDPQAVRALCDRLAATAPPLLVTGQGGRIVWDPATPERLGSLRAELRVADGVAVRAVDADLAVVERHSRAFLAAVVDPDALPAPQANTFQTGYAYLHGERRLIAYNLHEAGMERLHGPSLPYARAMLGARTAHEWGHLADAAGFVSRIVLKDRYVELRAALATQLDAVIAAAPAAVRRQTADDLAALAADGSPGAALARLTLTRMPDWRANLVSARFVTADEGETYVRHNIRTLRPEYPPDARWRMLIRYLFEYQYLAPVLGLTQMPDPRAYFLGSTWFADDFLATGIVDDAGFDALAAAVAALCACHAVDETRLRVASP